MPLFLTPDSKVALLEQSMKVELRRDPPIESTCFPKVLLVNRGFVDLARRNSVYRFWMSPRSKSKLAEFWFEGNETGEPEEAPSFKLSLDQAYKWIKFLNPPFFNVCGCWKDSPYLCLMSCVNGVQTSQENAVTSVIKCFWFQINELDCTLKFLKSSAVALPSKTFDRLDVGSIGSTDDLKWVLKQKATRLAIHISSANGFVKGIRAPNEEAFVNNIVEKCEVNFFGEDGPAFGIISTIVNTCPNLKHLKISCTLYIKESPTIGSAVGHLASTNLFVERMITKLKGLSIECVVRVRLDIWSSEDKKYPRDCVEMLRCGIRHFESVQEETQHMSDGTFNTCFTVKHKDQNVSINYGIDIYYNRLNGDDIDEMYKENLG